MLKLNTKLVNEYITNDEMTLMQPFVTVAHNMIEHKTGAGNDFLGWVDLPLNYDKEEFARIKEASSKINNDSEVLLVIGIGGSYLGAKAVIDFLKQ